MTTEAERAATLNFLIDAGARTATQDEKRELLSDLRELAEAGAPLSQAEVALKAAREAADALFNARAKCAAAATACREVAAAWEDGSTVGGDTGDACIANMDAWNSIASRMDAAEAQAENAAEFADTQARRISGRTEMPAFDALEFSKRGGSP